MNINSKDITATFGRLLLVLLFLISGFGKLAAPTGTIAYIASSGMPFPTLSYAAAIFIELILATLLLIGFQARLAALLIAIFALVTATMFHRPLSDPNQFIHFFKNVSIAGGMLQVVVFGAGNFSIDGWLANKRK